MLTLRIVGAALVIAGCAAVGFRASAGQKKRLRALEALIAALGQMRGEISGRRTPMPELFGKLARESSQPADRLFERLSADIAGIEERSLAEIWREDLWAELPALPGPARETAAALGPFLGRYDASEQAEAISAAMRRLEIFLTDAREEAKGSFRVYTAVGIAAGVMAVLVLL